MDCTATFATYIVLQNTVFNVKGNACLKKTKLQREYVGLKFCIRFFKFRLKILQARINGGETPQLFQSYFST